VKVKEGRKGRLTLAMLAAASLAASSLIGSFPSAISPLFPLPSSLSFPCFQQIVAGTTGEPSFPK
jgi:hypothetical protein